MTFTKSPPVTAPSPAARKSPLRAATLGGIAPAGAGLRTAEILTAGTGHQWEGVPAPDLRRMQISYLACYGQGGTNTRQRNLRHLFTWLEETCGHPQPWDSRAAPARARAESAFRAGQEFIHEGDG